LQGIIAIALISLEAIYLNSITNKYEVLYKNSYLPALMYALLMSSALSLLFLHPVIIANLFLLRALDRLFMLFKNESAISPLFDSLFFASIASIIYFPAFALIILFLAALAIIRPFSFREWMIAVIGFTVPYFFFGVYFFWMDQLKEEWKIFLNHFRIAHWKLAFTVETPLLVLFAVIGCLLLLSINRLRKNYFKNIIRTRVNQQILVIYFIVAMATCFLLNAIPLFQLTMVAIPLAVFFGYYFLADSRKPWISEFLLWILIAVIAWNHF
jgi:hypothetical protein